ncbi:Syntaxin-6 [Merluccius polli]|uniref:Syntaxin-6 n=1 Tax=Merluccius polli TaxID=89951 RepID=A0AA47P3C7_MERPO|nr:Syntaxin-6 [Merluccius polli]
MSMEDPFFVVRGEVQKAVNSAQGLHQRWTDLLRDPGTATKEEVDWTTNELRNSLRSIEWDLEDLDETINILQQNPVEQSSELSSPQGVWDPTRTGDHQFQSVLSVRCVKFNLDTLELSKRKAFITSTRQSVKEMKEHMSSPAAMSIPDKKNRQGPAGGPGSDRYTRLDHQLHTANSLFIGEQHTQQQLIVEQQDDQLELVSGAVGVLKNMSERIGLELDEQAVMLDDFTHEVDNTHSKLDNVMKKLAKVSHMTSDRRQWCAIGVLLCILLVVLLLFFIL